MPEPMMRVLIVDDEPSMRETLEIVLRKQGLRIDTAPSGEKAIELCEHEDFDVVLTDMRMPGMSGIDLLRRIKSLDESVEVVMITAFADTAQAVEAMKAGAYDYLIKPFDLDELTVLVRRAGEKRKLGTENLRLRTRLRERRGAPRFVAVSPAMSEVAEIISKVADQDVTVLITGESGVGKEIIAREIHDRGKQRDGPFVAVNCGALPEALVEAELFGYERGAFTGAVQAKAGLIEQAERGTLFLDEIGELPLAAQVKLLRVVQEQSVRRLGARKERALQVRFLAATNRDLSAAVANGSFREDLYYRINVIHVHVPPLRDRPEDIPALVDAIVESIAGRLGMSPPKISPAVIALLRRYHFPGNVRELANLMERAVILSRGGPVEPEHFPREVTEGLPATAGSARHATLGAGFRIEEHISAIERELFDRAIREAGGARGRAAELLGLSFRQFRYKAKKLGL